MTYQQSYETIESKIDQYIELFLAALEDKHGSGDAARDVEFVTVLEYLINLASELKIMPFILEIPKITRLLMGHIGAKHYHEESPKGIVRVVDSQSSRETLTIHNPFLRTFERRLDTKNILDSKVRAFSEKVKYLQLLHQAKSEPGSLSQDAVVPVRDLPANRLQGGTPAKSSVSFNDTDLIVIINGRRYLFEETTKKHRKTKLGEAYKLFKFLYENQHRRVKKDEIGKVLQLGNNEQRVFNAASKAKKVIECSPYSISTEKEYGDRGGYLLVVKKIDLESS